MIIYVNTRTAHIDRHHMCNAVYWIGLRLHGICIRLKNMARAKEKAQLKRRHKCVMVRMNKIAFFVSALMLVELCFVHIAFIYFHSNLAILFIFCASRLDDNSSVCRGRTHRPSAHTHPSALRISLERRHNDDFM